MSTKTPVIQITVNGQARDWQTRITSLTLNDARGFEADQLDIELDDADGRLQIPQPGALIQLFLGHQGEPLHDKGTYTVDELAHSGPPDRLTLRARAADISGSLKEQRRKSWDQQTLWEIVTRIGEGHNLQAAVSDSLADILIDHIDQTNESDANFLTRLAETHDAIATVKSGHLIFTQAGQSLTASGKAMPGITINRRQTTAHQYSEQTRGSAWTGVKGRWMDNQQAKVTYVLAGEEGKVKSLKKTYPTEAEARAAAEAELRKIARAGKTCSVTLSPAEFQIIPELPVKLTGWNTGIDSVNWVITNVTHRLQNGGLTEISLENSDTL